MWLKFLRFYFHLPTYFSKLKLKFFKFEGTGNDFIIVDNRSLTFPKSQNIIAQMCHRRFGIGADGLILLENSKDVHFKMVYYNSDGLESTMCGNGGRCIVSFAHMLGLIDKSAIFDAIDGRHKALVIEDVVSLELNVRSWPQKEEQGYFLHTGSPHLVIPVENPDKIDVESVGRSFRYSERFKKDGGVNVNFMSKPDQESKIFVRTYERGVEAETLSCGTGVTAAALVASLLYGLDDSVTVMTKGGELRVGFSKKRQCFEHISLTALTRFVFEGKYYLP